MTATIAQPPRIVPLDSSHDRAAFACGKAPLDLFLQRQARQEMKRLVSVTYVLVGAHAREIAGYYTLSATSVLLADLPDATARRLPRYPAVPATLLGRLAVATKYQRQRLGELLLMDALRRSADAGRSIGSTAVVTDAKDEEAQRFYERYGFIPLNSVPQRLFLPMATVQQLFA
jgi:ribosomal protein S18 acetylase RimI-like enzyme